MSPKLDKEVNHHLISSHQSKNRSIRLLPVAVQSGIDGNIMNTELIFLLQTRVMMIR